MKFYVLNIPGVETARVRLLEKAAKKNKVTFRLLDPYSYDFSGPSPLNKGDILFRASRGKILRTFENFLLCPGLVTFYSDPVPRRRDPFTLLKENIFSPKTIYCATSDRRMLMKYVKKLGGFPIVVKALGGTHGLGVMKIDTESSLFGVIDFLLAQGRIVILREYIPVKNSARFIVLGSKVIASLEYQALNHDFRTNEAKVLQVVPKHYPKELEDLSVKATKAMGLEFGGVDILVKGAKAYVSEVNFPCNFVRAQNVSKVDIASQMVDYLLRKGREGGSH